MEKIKVYTVKNGEICEAEARETPKKYIIDGKNLHLWAAFGYKYHFYKDEVHLTAIGAVEAQIARSERNLEMAKKRIHSINSELWQLKKLKKGLTNTPLTRKERHERQS